MSNTIKVFVYFNLHKHCWSIKALSGESKGRVIGHAHAVEIHDVVFKVSEAGRQRVLREKRKNVHAGIVGTLWAYTPADGGGNIPPVHDVPREAVTYNPYKGPTFTSRQDGRAVHKAGAVIANGRDVTAYYVE